LVKKASLSSPAFAMQYAILEWTPGAAVAFLPDAMQGAVGPFLTAQNALQYLKPKNCVKP
jgi:hypothetical protein